mmetsp:Transcript_10967/g.36026  ORF Transcript_10967/g.36026 Transcript_10967/m.36026 type:complete len:331 (+) Transcript_10967:801-1793(+)
MSVHLEVLPHDERLDGAHVEARERVIHAEDELAGVLGDFVKVLANQSLLLHKLDVGENVGAQLDRLIEAVLAAVRHVDDVEYDGAEPRVEHVALCEIVLEVGGAGEDESGDVRPVSRDEELRRELCHLADVVVPLFEAQARETQRRLPATTVLLWQVHGKLVQNLARVARERPKQRRVAVHHDETVFVVRLQQLVQSLRVELVVTQIQRGVDRLEGLEIHVHFLLLPLVRQNCPRVNDQSVRRNLVVQLQPLLCRCDGAKHGLSVHSVLDVARCAKLISQHLGHTGNLILRRHNQRNHRSSVASRTLQRLDQLLDLPHLDVALRLRILRL